MHQTIATRGGTFDAKRNSRLIVGPWSHSALGKRQQGDIDFGPAAELDLQQLYVEWFSHWLRQDRNDVDQWAPIRLFVMGANEWRNFHEWPPKYAQQRTLFLGSRGSLGDPLPGSNGAPNRNASGAAAGERKQALDRGASRENRLLSEQPPTTDARDEYHYDPRHPVPTLWTKAMFTAPADQRPLDTRPDILVYQTPPLTEHVETIGYPELVLYAASSCPDTDFFARLIDVSPDGHSIDITSGMVRARYRESLDKPKLLKPNEVTEFHVKLRPTAHRFLVGHRIRLDVTSSDFPNYDRNHNTAADQNADAELVTARQTIHHGPTFRSRLILPVMP